MVRPFLSIIIPAKNSVRTLALWLMSLDKYLESADFSHEIVVVDDASTDGTADMLDRFAKIMKNLRFEKLAAAKNENRGNGLGCVLRKGIQISRGTWRIFFEIDGRIPVEELHKIIPHLRDDIDVVLGVRAKILSGRRPIGERVINWLAKRLLPSTINDFFVPLRAFSDRAAGKIFEYSRYDTSVFDLEAPLIAERAGYEIRQIPVALGSFRASYSYDRRFFPMLIGVFRLRRLFKKRFYTEPARLL